MNQYTNEYSSLREKLWSFGSKFNYDKEVLAWNAKCLDISIALYLYEYPNDKHIVPPFPPYKNETFTGLFHLNRSKLINQRIDETLKPLNLNPIEYEEIKPMIVNKINTTDNISNLLLIDLCNNYFSISRKKIFNGEVIFQTKARYEDYKDLITFLIDKKHWLINIHNEDKTYSSLAKELMGISELSRGMIRDWRDNPNECKILNMKPEWDIKNYITFIGDNKDELR